ncbi:FAD/NAD(P)-binding protein [Nocardiopsis sp. HNM0947]|uniref:FAD/NAD(P)-binding protein n=1 Tax=Nocardiopsis coralli TaxID=2772213 RepID=A0ABR9P3M9_9ACTN|nr:FAD/NAD(P)-binding protein [Nocardiopsis coralli]MBE2998446.1 FAD/NAD(P)-binding protein [Nocardiopsis coralli]
MTSPAQARPYRIALVGGGPRSTSLLERIAANLPLLAPGRRVYVHVLDPFPPGAGRIWRREQSEHLWMNTTAGDCTMYTDPSVTCDGPIVQGPTLTEWATRLAAGGLERPPGFTTDEHDLAEARRVSAGWFSTRRLLNRYLAWVFHDTAARARGDLSVRALPSTVVDLLDLPGGGHRLVLEPGFGHLDADAVVLAQGGTPTAPTDEEERLARHADDHGLVHLPTAPTADADLDRVPPGARVLVRGLGLAFVDTVVLLTSGRGGTFVRSADGTLRYRPSGREPLLWAGSRRGVPYHSKLHYDLPGARPPLPRHLTPEVLAGGGKWNLGEDVWPLILREITHAHYHELATQHPERLAVPAREFLDRLETLDWEGPGLKHLVTEAVPHEHDVFDVERIDRPLAGLRFGGHEELADWMRTYMRGDLERRRDEQHSPDLAVFFALLSVFGVLSEALAAGRIAPENLTQDLDRFRGFFSFLASGPPGPRLEELLALTDAGVLRFTGANTAVEPVPGGFEASSDSTGATVRAEALVEARLPRYSLERTTDPLLSALRARGRVRARADDGLIDTDPEQRLVDSEGRAHPMLFGAGIMVAGGVGSGGFSRPRTDAGFFRQNDRLARTLLAPDGSDGSGGPGAA